MNKNLFNSIEVTKPSKNVFDLTHDFKFTGDMGELIPIMALETVPGDKFTLGGQAIVKFAPLLAPIMHRVDVTIHYWFVPKRIVWDGWDKWIVDPEITVEHPYVQLSDSLPSFIPLLDYFGIPPTVAGMAVTKIDPTALASYQAIYNEYYRDQNLIAEVDYKLTPGNNTSALLGTLGKLRLRAWEHDYFTAALPWAQKAQAVNIPLGDVTLKDLPITTAPGFVDLGTGVSLADGAASLSGGTGTIQTGATQGAYDPRGSLTVEPTQINDLRRAYKLQEWLEKNARGGTRYKESILNHFGVRSSDARLQRPEYITGIKTPVVISEVLNTTGETLPQGNMSGHGVSVTTGRTGSYFCEEHGHIIGILSVIPRTAYQDGIAKQWLKIDDPFQYYWPSFAHIGEQEVLNKELLAYTPDQDAVFGYVPRYAEYKYMPSRVAGDFRTNLSYWHLGRQFDVTMGSVPLNQSFVECVPRKDIFAVIDDSSDSLYCHVLNIVKAVRPMPYFGTPSM